MKSSEQRKNVWRSAHVKLLPTKNCPPLSVSFFSNWVWKQTIYVSSSHISWLFGHRPELLGMSVRWAWPAPLAYLENTRPCTETGFYIFMHWVLTLLGSALTLASIASWTTSTISSTMAASRLFLPVMLASLATKRQMDMDWQIFSPFNEKC